MDDEGGGRRTEMKKGRERGEGDGRIYGDRETIQLKRKWTSLVRNIIIINIAPQ